jgi:hypothetical protein
MGLFVVGLMGIAAVAVNQASTSTALAAAPDRPVITDVELDDEDGEIRVHLAPSNSGSAPTSYNIQMCNESVMLNTITSPLVVDYEDVCIAEGGFDGWQAVPNQTQVYMYVYPVNGDGYGNAATYEVRPYRPSVARVTSTTPYKDGCMATFTMRSYPSWATRVFSAIWDDANSSSGGGGGITFDFSTGIGQAFIPYADYPTSWLDRAVVMNVGVGGILNGQDFGVQGAKTAEFSCPDDPSGALTQPATPTIQVVPRSGGFTLNWSIANTGSHPVKMAYLTLYSSATSQGATTILDSSSYTNVPTSASVIESSCKNPINYDLANGFTYSPYCQTPWATNIELYSTPLMTSGTIDSATMWDSNANAYLTLDDSRTYWVSMRVVTYAGAGSDATAQSSGSNLVEINPGNPPTVTAVSPSSGSAAGGTAVTITGTGFAGGATVTVGGAACTNVLVASATEISCTTPAGTAGTASVVVTSSGRSSVANTLFSYTAPSATTTVPAPVATPTLVNSGNQSALTAQPGAATAIVNGQTVTPTIETPANLPAAAVDPEDRSPAQVQSLQSAADSLVNDLNQAAGGNSGLAVVDTPTGANLTGLLSVPVPIENTVLVEAANKSTLFAALNQDGSVTEVQPGAVIEVLGNGQVGVFASGLTPGESAEFVIMSTPTLLGAYTVDANGSIRAQASLPSAIGLGNHTLVVASPTVQASLGLKVTAGALPATGLDDSGRPITLALWLLAGGAFIVVLRRRRVTLD